MLLEDPVGILKKLKMILNKNDMIDFLKSLLEIDNKSIILVMLLALTIFIVFFYIINSIIKAYRTKRMRALDLDITSSTWIIPDNLGKIDKFLLKKYITRDIKARTYFNRMYALALEETKSEREKEEKEKNQYRRIKKHRLKNPDIL